MQKELYLFVLFTSLYRLPFYSNRCANKTFMLLSIISKGQKLQQCANIRQNNFHSKKILLKTGHCTLSYHVFINHYQFLMIPGVRKKVRIFCPIRHRHIQRQVNCSLETNSLADRFIDSILNHVQATRRCTHLVTQTKTGVVLDVCFVLHMPSI